MASAAGVKTGHNVEGTVVERINNMREAIEAGADEAQQLRHLPSWLTDQMVKENIFLFTCPPEYGGEDATVQETIDVLEAMAAIDGSVGWNVMIGSEINAMAAGGLPEERVKEVFLDNPGVIMCGGGGPGTSATPYAKKVDGGYAISAETSFMSGCHNSTWAFQNAPLVNDEGEPILDENGNRKEFKKNRSGNVVTSTLNEAVLDEISRTTGGTFIRIENQVNAITPLLQQLKQMEKKELKSHIFSQYEDRYQIFLLIGLLLLLMEFVIPTRTKEEMIWEGRYSKNG